MLFVSFVHVHDNNLHLVVLPSRSNKAEAAKLIITGGSKEFNSSYKAQLAQTDQTVYLDEAKTEFRAEWWSEEDLDQQWDHEIT